MNNGISLIVDQLCTSSPMSLLLPPTPHPHQTLLYMLQVLRSSKRHGKRFTLKQHECYQFCEQWTRRVAPWSCWSSESSQWLKGTMNTTIQLVARANIHPKQHRQIMNPLRWSIGDDGFMTVQGSYVSVQYKHLFTQAGNTCGRGKLCRINYTPGRGKIAPRK